MKLIVGLGNPGEKYEHTRHNLGFMVLDKFLKECTKVEDKKTWQKETRFRSELAEIKFKEEKVILCKPLTYMNLSGNAVSAISHFYKTELSDIWIIHDDVDLNLGAIKIRNGGASAGHKGIESIINSLNDDKFWRFRLGIGHPLKRENLRSKFMAVDKYVLKTFGRGEGGKLKDIIKKAVKALESSLEIGLDKTMNKFNAK